MINFEDINFWKMGWEMFLTIFKMWKLWLPLLGMGILLILLAIGQRRLENWFEKLWRKKRYKDIANLERLRGLSGTEFEEFTAHLFEKLGYKITLTGGSHDGGVDLVAIKDGKSHYIQCKKYTNKIVSVGAVRDFYGAIADKLNAEGYFITTQFFTIEAKKFAEGKPIQLIDQFRLLDMMKLAGDEPEKEGVCPSCGKKLVHRKGKFGDFIGCSGYPTCSYTTSP